MKSFDDELVHKTVRELFDMLKSKQAEVDELRKRIDEAIKELECIHFYKTQNSNNAIKILKGDQL